MPQRTIASACMALALACAVGGNAQAATMWDESVLGDLSNSGLSPTSVGMSLGVNRVVGSVGDSGQGIDRDYFSFTVLPGTQLSSLVLLNNTSVSGGASFMAIQAGPQVTVSPTGAGVENLLGFLHYGNDQIGTDLLPVIALGYVGALPSGTYSVWVQETGGPASYGFDFTLSAVPEPATAMLLLGGLVGLTVTARRR